MQPDTPQTNRQQLRQALEEAILFRVRDEIDEVIETLPPDVTEEIREGIRQEVLPHTQHVMGALSLGELQNEGALLRHVGNSVSTAQYLVDCVVEKQRRGQQ